MPSATPWSAHGRLRQAANDQPWIIGVVKERETLAKIAQSDGSREVYRGGAGLLRGLRGEEGEVLPGGLLLRHHQPDSGSGQTVSGHVVAGDRNPDAGAVRHLPQGPDTYTLVSLVPAGYPADIAIVPKKDISAISFSERFVPR